MRQVPAALRVALLTILLLLVFAPPRDREEGGIIELEGQFREDVPTGAARAFVRRAGTAPTANELLALEALAARAPLVVARPALPLLMLEAPDRAIAGRAAALPFHLIGAAGDTLTLHLADPAGLLDSATVVLDRGGVAHGAFTVRPPADGWHEWSVSTAAATARTGAWVRPEAGLRLLVVPGPASWEGREVARALERAGVEVTLAQPLGRGLAIGGAPAGLPADPDALYRWDAVLVLAGAPLDPASRRALDTYTMRGGGALVAGAGDAARPDSTRGDAIRWTPAPGIPPLPPADIAIRIAPVASNGEATRTVTFGPRGEPLLVLRPAGRGRSASLGLLETWRWGLQAGRNVELTAFWIGLAEWLAGGVREDFTLDVSPGQAPAGTAVDVAVAAWAGDTVPPRFRLRGPGGRDEPLPVGRAGSAGTARFVAIEQGLHTLSLPNDTAVLAAHIADPPVGGRADAAASAPPDAWPRLAFAAHRSGGAVVPADSIDAVAARLGDAPRRPRLAFLLLLAALGLASAEWLLRRLRGLA